MKFVIIVDHSAGNDTVGEMWKETKIFDESATLAEVMEWADDDYHRLNHSRKNIVITRPHQEKDDLYK